MNTNSQGPSIWGGLLRLNRQFEVEEVENVQKVRADYTAVAMNQLLNIVRIHIELLCEFSIAHAALLNPVRDGVSDTVVDSHTVAPRIKRFDWQIMQLALQCLHSVSPAILGGQQTVEVEGSRERKRGSVVELSLGRVHNDETLNCLRYLLQGTVFSFTP